MALQPFGHDRRPVLDRVVQEGIDLPADLPVATAGIGFGLELIERESHIVHFGAWRGGGEVHFPEPPRGLDRALRGAVDPPPEAEHVRVLDWLGTEGPQSLFLARLVIHRPPWP